MQMQAFPLRTKRVYEAPEATDGQRVLVDRLWPRGLTKQRVEIAFWLKAIAPSEGLRKEFGHDVALWAQFRTRYWLELDHNEKEVDRLRQMVIQGPVTLVYGARDEAHNNAVALAEYLIART